MSRRCACVSDYRVDCVEARYLATREEALMEPCECPCHDETDTDDYADDWWADMEADRNRFSPPVDGDETE